MTDETFFALRPLNAAIAELERRLIDGSLSMSEATLERVERALYLHNWLGDDVRPHETKATLSLINQVLAGVA